MDFDMELYYPPTVFAGYDPTMEETEAATKAALEAELRGMRASCSFPLNHNLYLDVDVDPTWSALAAAAAVGPASAPASISGPSSAAGTGVSSMVAAAAAAAAAAVCGSNMSSSSNNSNNTCGSPLTPNMSINTNNEILIKSEPTENSSLPPESPTKKRRQPWGRQLTPPTTNLPPRKRAKTEAEKQQRAYERVIRNRKAAETSRQRKQAQQDQLVRDLQAALNENRELKERIGVIQKECRTYKSRTAHLQLRLQGISNGSTAMPFKIEDQAPISPTKTEVSETSDAFISPTALTCESPNNLSYDEAISPTSSLAGSPETMTEDDSPRTPRTPSELKSNNNNNNNNMYAGMFNHYAPFSNTESILLPSNAEPRKAANALDLNEHFNDVFTALNYDRNTETTQTHEYVQNIF
ncbi:hypothetical protein TWF694_000068 [Orbilia ellipsospora]|uniref:BZIP domain-containing protein n=1 Tax=Orbilia ellipsospora TaxID=2528407 RepID=A0AAV9XQ43_9PEZI